MTITPAECWLERQYHKLVFEHHPDRGGSNDALVQINAEWDYLKTHNFNIHESMSGSVYTDERQDVPDEVTARFESENTKLRELVRELWTYAEQELLCDENCSYGTVCDWRDCVFERRMRELGVEV